MAAKLSAARPKLRNAPPPRSLTFWLVRASFIDTYSEMGMMLELQTADGSSSITMMMMAAAASSR